MIVSDYYFVMNPKLKLTLVLAIPVLGIALWIFSLFSLLSPADIAPDTQDTTNNQSGNTFTGLIDKVIVQNET